MNITMYRVNVFTNIHPQLEGGEQCVCVFVVFQCMWGQARSRGARVCCGVLVNDDGQVVVVLF